MKKSALSLLIALALPLSIASAGADRVYGEAMPTGDAQPVAAAIAAGVSEKASEPRKFSGRITEVCQAKGCWVMLEDDGQVARVMMKDHSISVPKDARGPAVVYGTLSSKTLDEKMAKHLAEDAGRDAPAPTQEFRITATSVELGEG